MLRNPLAPHTFRPDYFSDGMHPNPAGHQAIAAATPLRWFTAHPLWTGSIALLASTACIRRLVVYLRTPHGQPLRSARVFVNGKQVATARGRRLRTPVDLRDPRDLPTASPA